MKRQRICESPDGKTFFAPDPDDMDRLRTNWEILVGSCQSPIEVKMAKALFYRCALVSQRVPFVAPHWQEWRPKIGFTIHPQCRIGPYRADFAVALTVQETGKSGVFNYDELPAGLQIKLVVECDGHDFHDKYQWQQDRDKKRDRELLLAGWYVARYTGAEIFADPVRCADQVVEILHRLIEQEQILKRPNKGAKTDGGER